MPRLVVLQDYRTQLLIYLRIAGIRTYGFKSFLKVLAWKEMQTVSSRIWTQVTNSISYDNHCYTNHISLANKWTKTEI